jgi:ABC-type multidrug transport system fused ATPase/permease subunit
MKKYLLAIRKYIALEIALDLISSAALAFMPYLFKLLFDSADQLSLRLLVTLAALYALCVLVSLVATYLHMLVSWKGGVAFEVAMKRDFFKSIARYSYQKFVSKDVGEYISVQASEITQLEMDYLNPLLNIFKMANSIVVFGAVLLLLVDLRIGIVIIALSFFSAILVPTIGAKTISHRHKVYLDTRGEYMAKMKDLLEGFKLIRPDTRNSIFHEHELVLGKTAERRFQYGKIKSLLGVVRGFFLYLLNIVSFSLVGWFLLIGQITLGTAAATLGFIESFIAPIQSIITDMATIRGTRGIKEKVLAMLDWHPESDMPAATAFNEAIVFQGVTVRYQDFSLENFSFTFLKGKKYAIIGPNGSGKSTLVRALMKYVDLDAGKIYIDGKDLQAIDATPIMWCVDQHEHIFLSDFLSNITVFNTVPYEKALPVFSRLIGDAKLSSISKQENCRLLSGGEKQIIGLFRMMLADKDILLLDEPLSAMDSQVAQLMKLYLSSLTDKTIIKVTHDLTDHLDSFDEVLLIVDGKLCASGSWSQVKSMQELPR